MSFCAFLLLLAGCCLLGIKDPDGHAPIPDHPLFRWHVGWLPLGLALLFTCHAYGPGVGRWYGSACSRHRERLQSSFSLSLPPPSGSGLQKRPSR